MAPRFKMPHTLTLLFILMVGALIATWVIPQGQFQTEVTETGMNLVVPGTFELVDEPTYLSPWDLFTAIPRAFAAAQNIIFFLFIVGGVVALIRASGTIDALLGGLLNSASSRPALLMFAVIFVFALTSSAMGASAEYIPFVLILVALCRALKMDTMVAVGMIVAGYGIGYGMASFNQYTVIPAQEIAGVPTYTGWAWKLALLVPFCLIGLHHVWSYARRVQKDPSKSLVKDMDPPDQGAPPAEYPPMSARHFLIIFGFVAALGISVYGIREWGWYLNELGGAFLVLGLATAAISRISASETARRFVAGAGELVETALLVGVARGIALIMEDGEILHSIVHALSRPLGAVGPELAAVGMLTIQSVLNFFVPSGSGQAFVTMPLMAPLGDIVGVSREVAVLAFQFGDGFSNMLVPTNAVLMGILGMAAIPYDRWFRFCFPLFLKLFLAAALVLVAAVLLGVGVGPA